MDPDIDKENEYGKDILRLSEALKKRGNTFQSNHDKSINQRYASNEQRIEELNAIKEQIQNAKDDLERDELTRKALLDILSKKGMLTQQGFDELYKPHHAETPEINEFTENPLLGENMNISHKNRK